MKNLNVFLFEWRHFVKNPFKIVALILFMLAGIYGLHNGADLYHKQQAEIERISSEVNADRQEIINYYKEGVKGPEDRPWVDVTNPYWALRYAYKYHFKLPSAAMVYSIGQTEQFGFYKQVTFGSSPLDADMTKEIANPERLQIGTLDFSFVILFLLPLVLIILIYNVGSFENEQGFLNLVLVQYASINKWLLSRVLFYMVLTFLCVIALMIYGTFLTDVFTDESQAFMQITFLVFLYLVMWTVLFFFVLKSAKNILSNTLSMVGIYLLFTFIIPAMVHQWVSIDKPANLMTDFIDATRDEREKLYNEPEVTIHAKLVNLFPEIKNTKTAQDSILNKRVVRRSIAALGNQLTKKSVESIAEESQEKNRKIQNTYWFNPVVYFQNQLNQETRTHYQNYQDYSNNIQSAIDEQVKELVLDMYDTVKVDEKRYLNYTK
ncbi:MAG: hypothetical protein HRT68_01980 [Flavobacteriaceae bacterium]|nr:hypothetical protein [Flavobacteriaceae bacterium]